MLIIFILQFSFCLPSLWEGACACLLKATDDADERRQRRRRAASPSPALIGQRRRKTRRRRTRWRARRAAGLLHLWQKETAGAWARLLFSGLA